MPLSFVLMYVLVGVALVLALTSIPLAVREARSAYWWTHAGIAFVLTFVLAGMLYWQVYGGMVAWWRCLVANMGIALSVISAGWAARRSVRLWPRARRTGAVLGALVGLVLVWGLCAMATNGMLPDIINAST